MTSAEILDVINSLKVKLWVENGNLRFRAPKHAITPELKEAIKENKFELIDLLNRQTNTKIVGNNLSYNQQSLWFLYQLAPKSPAYNIAIACRVVSEIKVDALVKASEKLIASYSILRTTYGFVSEQDNIPCQKIQNKTGPFFEQIDAANWKDDVLKERIEEYYKTPFDLENGPIFRVHLFSRGAHGHVLLLTVHHIACDAWSLSVLLDDLKSIYQSEIDGLEAKLNSNSVHYSDFITFQNKLLQGPEGDRLLSYWRGKLDGMAPYINLPIDFERPSVQNFRGSSFYFNIEKPFYTQITNFAKAEGVTLFTVLLSAFQCLLMRISQQNDILIGIPTAGRYKREFSSTCGFFVNPVVLRGNLMGTLTFRELLKETSKNIMEALDHQKYPFPLLVDKLMPKRNPGRSPIFQIMFNMLKRKTLGSAADFLCPSEDSNPVNYGPLRILPFPIKQQEGQYDITLEIIDTDSFLFCCIKYCTDLFSSHTITHMSEDFQTILKIVIEDPEYKLYKLPIKKENKGEIGADEDKNIRKLIVAASFTPDNIQPYLEFWMKKIKLDSRIVFASYNQIFQQILDPASDFSKNTNGVNIILLRFDDWLKEYEKESKELTPEIILNMKRNAGEFIRSLNSFMAESPVPLLVLFCPSSPDILAIEDFKSLIHQTESELSEKINKTNGLFVINSSEILSTYPLEDYHESIGEKVGHIPYTQDFFVSIATIISRKIFTINRRPFKAIVLDCDQTLWNGIVGEDGLKGVTVDKGKKVFQEFLLSQYRAGLLLCVCSKNNEHEVLDVFDNHPDMVLKKSHFVSRRINWMPKSQNIKSMSKELNIGLESFIFIDDNPVECAEVRSNYPSVLTLQLPEQGKNISRFINNIWAFDRLKITQEDSSRSRFYGNAQEREKFYKETFSFSNFIQGLGLKIEILNLSISQIPRISQLTLRTNQFNLSTIRRSEGEINKFHETGNSFCYTVNVNDRFGDYGLVGVMMVEKTSDSLNVDTFLLSCRALGRGVEHRMLAYLGKEARKWKLSYVNLIYKPTEKNVPIYDFLTSIGMEYEEEKDTNHVFTIPASTAVETTFTPRSSSDTSSLKTNKKKPDSSNDLSYDQSLSHLMEEIANKYYDIRQVQNAIESEKRTNSHPKGKVDSSISKITQIKLGSETEKRIASVWKDILGLDTINSNANFFDLGGRSILIPQVIIHLKKIYDIEIDIIDMLKFPTVQLLANYCDKSGNESPSQNQTANFASKQKAAIDQQRKRTKLARKIVQK